MSEQFFKTREEIKAWLEEMGVTGYTLRDDLTVDGFSANLNARNLTHIPVQFGDVDWFGCNDNRLTSLKGVPKKCVGLGCNNNKLTSLAGAPESCRRLTCNNNQLVSLDGIPRELNYIECKGNPDLFDISAALGVYRIDYEHDVVGRNQATRQQAAFGGGGDPENQIDKRPKSGRTL